MALWQVLAGGERRLARGPAGRGPQELLPELVTIDGLLGGPPGALAAALAGPAAGPVPAGARVVAPVGGQEVWAAGVTYTRSLDARVAESGTPDPYERVYVAERPELFFKAAPGRVRGPGEPVGIRADSAWDVPEPELAVVADSGGRIVGFVNGNDMSSRSIEGENPLYLPQAKIYYGACAVGPWITPVWDVPDPYDLAIDLAIDRDGREYWQGRTSTSLLRRRLDDLAGYLMRGDVHPAHDHGVISRPILLQVLLHRQQIGVVERFHSHRLEGTGVFARMGAVLGQEGDAAPQPGEDAEQVDHPH